MIGLVRFQAEEKGDQESRTLSHRGPHHCIPRTDCQRSWGTWKAAELALASRRQELTVEGRGLIALPYRWVRVHGRRDLDA